MEAIVKARRYYRPLRDIKFTNWMIRVMKTVLIDAARKREDRGFCDPLTGNEMVNIEDALINRIGNEQLLDGLLSKLTQAQLAVTRAWLEDTEEPDRVTAERIGVTLPAFKSQLYRARNAMQQAA
jgi:DNA-directed RNA polymerase specialized sigma24 family protein